MIVSRPEAVRHILVANADNYVRPQAAFRVLDPPIGGGLFLAEGEEWRRQRRLLAPTFAPRSTARLAGQAARHAAAMLDRLRRGPDSVPLYDVLQGLTMAVAAGAVLGIDIAPYHDDVRRMAARYTHRLAQPDMLDFLLPRWMPSPRDLMRSRFRRRWMALVARIVEDQRRRPDAGDSLFARLDASETPRGTLCQQVATLLVTGSETTTAALYWSIHLIAARPDMQAQIAAEADAAGVGEGLDEDAAAAALERLPGTGAVVSEAMRLYPPAFSIVRQALAADVADGVAVPAGAIVQTAPWVIHRHRRLWDRPDEFDPARFLPGAPPPRRFTYLPFGIGPRQCIAAGFALAEAKLVLAMLLREFEVSPTTGRPVAPVAQITLQPDDPPPFRLTPRWDRVSGT